MQFLKYAVILPLVVLLMSSADARQRQLFYEVPFKHVEVVAGGKIYMDYKFNPRSEKLICKEEHESGAITSAEWDYKGASRKIGLPVTLVGLPDVSTSENWWYADYMGRLTISNEFGAAGPYAESDSIFVSCEYRPIVCDQ